MQLRLGDRRVDVTHRALVMGILNRTPDSFYDRGSYFDLDAFWRRVESLVAAGADILDVGGVKAGPGPEVGLEEELERVVAPIAGIVERFDVPVSVDTWRAEVASEAFRAGAVLGNDISGFADPGYLAAAATAGATVVATHIRLTPRVADPDPHYDDVVTEVASFLTERASRALAAGVDPEGIVIDAGLDLGKTAAQSLELLRATGRLAGLGWPLLLSASNKTFLGAHFDLPVERRGGPTLAAHALGTTLGARILRAHDVRAARRVADTVAAISAALDHAALDHAAPDHAAPGRATAAFDPAS